MEREPLVINIQPPVSVYATYRRLSYQPWYAIAEFVDNSTQNYYDHKHELDIALDKEGGRPFKIDIQYDSENNELQIYDNANGMDFSELQRAVMLNRPPVNNSGRCEYGMGLKTAACWFGKKWSIETTRLGATEKYTVSLDVDKLSHENSEKLIVNVAKLNQDEHYTIIKLFDLYKPLKGRTTQRIKDQLSSMYREDLRSEEMSILWNGSILNFDEAPIFEEVYNDGTRVKWKKNVEFKVSLENSKEVLHVKGWIGIRLPGSQRDAGFVLLRRGRVIVGGPERGYKPEEIFGQGNSYSSQRLIGELKLDEWPVTQAKDAFDWSGGLEDKFIEVLKEHCKDYIQKAEGHREKTKKLTKAEMEVVAEETKRIFESKTFSSSVSAEISLPTVPIPQEIINRDLEKIEKISDGPIEINLTLPRGEWKFKLFWQNQLSDAPWMSMEFPQENEIHIFLNADHPFFEPYLSNLNMISLIQKLVISLALAEKLARNISSNNKIDAADFRNYMNWVLKYAGQIREDNNA